MGSNPIGVASLNTSATAGPATGGLLICHAVRAHQAGAPVSSAGPGHIIAYTDDDAYPADGRWLFCGLPSD